MATESNAAAPPEAAQELKDDLRRELKRELDRLIEPWTQDDSSRPAGSPLPDAPDPDEQD